MKLSKRLKAILDLVPQDSVLVDIGTDHGWLIVEALKQKKVSKAYALDIAPKPLDQARKNVNMFGFDPYVSFQLRDGLEGFNEDADCYVIAGMGAETIYGIIKGYKFKNNDTIIVQSNTKVAWLRAILAHEGFLIFDEVFFVDKGIPTFIMKLKLHEPHTLDEVSKWVGPVLKNKYETEYLSHINGRIQHLDKIKHHDVDLAKEYDVLKRYTEQIEKGVIS